MQYCTARGTNMGPVGENFAATCDLLDRADLMLTGPPVQARPAPARPGQAWPETDGPPALALARRDPASHTIILAMDAATASTAIFAITAHADEREAHVREVRQFGQALPEGSWGQRNRQAIAARETRIAARLRAVQHAYQAALERDTALPPPEPAAAGRPAEQPADREIELE